MVNKEVLVIPFSKAKLNENIEIYGFSILDDRIDIELTIYKDSDIFETVRNFLEDLIERHGSDKVFNDC